MGNKGSVTSVPNEQQKNDNKPTLTVATTRPELYSKEDSMISTNSLLNQKSSSTTPTPKSKELSTTPSLYPKEPSTITVPLKNGDASKNAFYSTVLAANPHLDRTKVLASSSFNRWYRWRDQEIRPANNGKSMWYRKPVESTDNLGQTTVETKRFHVEVKDSSLINSNEIRPMASFQLRTTAVPSAMLRQPVEIEKIFSKDETSTDPNAPSATEISTHRKPVPFDGTDLPTFISRGIQADLQTASAESSSGIPVRYYERQPVKIVPLSTLSNLKSNNEGFYHLPSPKSNAEPVLPPIEKTPVWTENGQNPIDLPMKPTITTTEVTVVPKTSASVVPPVVPPSVAVAPQLPKEDPLSAETHEKVVAEMRKQNQDVKEGTYRVKKIHFFEKLPWAKSGASKNRPKSSRAIESISRSEQLFFSQSSSRKK